VPLTQFHVGRKIRVNWVSPEPVWTPLNVADTEPEKVAHHGAETPLKRPAQPEAVECELRQGGKARTALGLGRSGLVLGDLPQLAAPDFFESVKRHHLHK
jgi:NAD(P)-dependent dehydrogenase (short-subunit alcohol dehydrogenase family)